MSFKISRKSLTEEQKSTIVKYLNLQPTPTGFVPKNFYDEPKPPITFYETDADFVYVPYCFGLSLFQKFINHEIKKPVNPYNFTGTLFHHQIEVVDEGLEHLKIKGTTTIGTYPGSGKTIMGAYMATKIYPEHQTETCLVIHPLTVLNESWDNTFKEFTNGTTWVVGEQSIPDKCPNVIICFDQRIDKIPQNFIDMVGVLIIDEAHKLCTPSKIHSLLRCQPKYIIAETATLERPDDGMHIMIHTLCGTHSINRISTKPFNVTKLLTGIKPLIQTTPRGVNWNLLVKSLCEDETRNKIICELVLSNLPKGWKIIILTNLKEHVTTLHQMLISLNVKTDFMMGTKKMYIDSQVLIGTVSKMGTGFDEKTMCDNFGGKRSDLLIYCTSTKKAGTLEQHIGRIQRADCPAVIHLVDDNPSIKRHWGEAKKWYVSRGAVITEMKMEPIKRVYNLDGSVCK